MSVDSELFGSQDQIAAMRCGASLCRLLQDDPRYSYYGQMVSLGDSSADALDRVCALTRLAATAPRAAEAAPASKSRARTPAASQRSPIVRARQTRARRRAPSGLRFERAAGARSHPAQARLHLEVE